MICKNTQTYSEIIHYLHAIVAVGCSGGRIAPLVAVDRVAADVCLLAGQNGEHLGRGGTRRFQHPVGGAFERHLVLPRGQDSQRPLTSHLC